MARMLPAAQVRPGSTLPPHREFLAYAFVDAVATRRPTTIDFQLLH